MNVYRKYRWELGVLIGTLTVGMGAVIYAASAPSLTTDKTSYSAGDTMKVSGSGFSASAAINLTVSRPDHLTDVVPNVISDSSGSFTASYLPSSPIAAGQYTLTATDGASSAVTASTVAGVGTMVTTDKSKYSVGDPMIISGAGYSVYAPISISVLRPDHETDSLSANSDGAGTFKVTYTPPGESGRYKITATDGFNSANTSSTEADAIGFDLEQCAQNDSANGHPLGLGVCNWIGSDLNNNDAKLYEGIATEQQLLITGMSGTTHSLTVGIEATKGGHHSYDWLVSDAQVSGGDKPADSTLNSEKASNEVGITLQLDRCTTGLGHAAATACAALVSTASVANTVDIPVPDDSFISWTNGGTSTQAKIDAYETHFGNRTVRLYTDSPTPITNVVMALEHRGAKLSGTFGDGSALANQADTGDSYIWYKITWTGGSQNAMLVAGADIALGGDATGRSWCAGCGATGINGDPYHFFLVDFDGTGGSLDNQMSAAAIFTPPQPATTLTLKSQTPAGTSLAVGMPVTLTVTETNTGTDTLTNVHVTGTGCTTWTPANVATFAPTATQDFTCTFTIVAGANAWTASALGTASTGLPAPTTNETVSGSISGLTTSTSLTLKSSTPADGTSVAVGTPVTIVVTETNTGTTSLSAVSVSGGGQCASFTGGATTLSAGASADFTCTFTTVAGANSWFADGHGTDQFNVAAPSAGEHASGSLTGLTTSTSLTLKSSSPVDGSNVAVGTPVTIVVTETNTGTTSLTGVSVTAGGKCTAFTGGAATLAAGASTDFTCTFTTVAGSNAWTADGVGTDQFGRAAPTTGEHAEGSLTALTTSTSLTLKSSTPANGSNVAVGTPVTIVVTETNTGTASLTGVSVTAGGKCLAFTGGATSLAAGASTDFTCTFTTTAGTNAWTADGVGTDQFGHAAPTTGEHAEGSLTALTTSTSLTLKSSTPANGSNVTVGTPVTIVVTETNTGTASLTGVSVTAGGKCTAFTGGATTLAAGASTDFTCTFTTVAGANAWTADGVGTDQFGHAAPATGEHAEGSLTALTTSTSLTLKSSTPANGSSVEVGTPVTIVVTETNTGTASLSAVNVIGGGQCATFTGGPTTLAAGASADFTCSFNTVLGANGWTADGVGTDQFGHAAPSTGEHQAGSVTGLLSHIVVNKFSRGGTATFNFESTNFTVNPITTTPDGSGNGTGSTGLITVSPGTYGVGEANPPTGWKLDASLCTVDGTTPFGTPTVVGGVNVSWSFTVPLGATVTCTFDNSIVNATTRTQGFWSTHTGLSNNVWNTLVPAADQTLCTTAITAIDSPAGANQLMGGFWANISQTTAKGGKRTPLDQARMQMLQQYLAAVLNVYQFGSGSEGLLSTARAAYCGSDAGAIQTQIGVLGSFNSSGDTGLFTPGVSATAQASKSEANIAFWDVTLH